MIDKSLIKQIFYEDNEDKKYKDISFIGSRGYHDPSSDKVPEESDIPVQGLENPYTKSGVDVASTYHPEDAKDVQEFVTKIEDNTGIKLSDKIVIGQDGLQDLMKIVNAYIDQYKFRYQNYNKQTDAKRAEIDSKIAQDTLNTMKKDSDKFAGSKIVNTLLKFRDAIASRIKMKNHGTSHGMKVAPDNAMDTFGKVYSQVVDSLSDYSKERFSKQSENQKFSLSDIDSVIERTEAYLIGIKKLIKKIETVNASNSDKDKAKLALEALQPDYFNKVDLFEDKTRPTLKLKPKAARKVQDKWEQEELERLQDEEKRAIIKRLKDYIDGNVSFDPEFDLVIEYYAMKNILKQLALSDNTAEQLLSELIGYDKKSDSDKVMIKDKVEKYINELLDKLQHDVRSLQSLINLTKSATNSWGWV